MHPNKEIIPRARASTSTYRSMVGLGPFGAVMPLGPSLLAPYLCSSVPLALLYCIRVSPSFLTFSLMIVGCLLVIVSCLLVIVGCLLVIVGCLLVIVGCCFGGKPEGMQHVSIQSRSHPVWRRMCSLDSRHSTRNQSANAPSFSRSHFLSTLIFTTASMLSISDIIIFGP